MGRVDPNRLGIVAAVLLAAWHGVWTLLVAAGVAKPVVDFVLRMHAMRSEVLIEPFDPGMAALLLGGTAVLGYVGGAAAATLWNWLGGASVRARSSGPVGASARA